MKIELITSYFREEFLAPLFMLHYESWVDKITILTSRFPENKIDDEIKMNLVNDAIAVSKADWVVVADFDEFIFPLPYGKLPRLTLEREQGSIIRCFMQRCWRHKTDLDIDRMKPPVPQRLHGRADHDKPCIFRPNGVKIGIGTHSATFPETHKWGENWSAAHWHNADPSFGLQRTMRDRQNRLSQNNLNHQWGLVPEWKDPAFLPARYQEHLDDPQVIILP